MADRSVPDELVQAAAEALCQAMGHGILDPGTCGGHTHEATVALEAAFAGLPECGTATVAGAVDFALEGMDLSLPDEVVGAIARTVVVALAREFGGQK